MNTVAVLIRSQFSKHKAEHRGFLESEKPKAQKEEKKNVGYGRRVRGHGPRRREDPKTREAERSGAP